MSILTIELRRAVAAITLLLGCCCVAPVLAQSTHRSAAAQQQNTKNVVRGCVCDENNVPMSGVVVRNLTNKQNAVTDKDGRFTMPCRGAGDRLTLTFIGKRAQEAKAELGGVMNFVMEDDETTLDDVVVTGYQTIKRTNATSPSRCTKTC